MFLRKRRFLTIRCTCASSAVLLGVVFATIYFQSFAELNTDVNVRQGKCCPLESSSSWYSLSAYPKINGPQQSWEWILQFISAVRQSIPDEDGKAAFPWLSQSPSAISIRLDSENTSSFEETYLGQLLQTKHWSKHTHVFPRYDCGHLACLFRKWNFTLRNPVIPATDDEIVLLHGLNTDLYDLRRLVAAVSAQPRILVTAITAVPSKGLPTTVRSENVPSSLYNFLQYVYFYLNWIPIHALQTDCENAIIRESDQGCRLWITWKRWRPDEPVRFFPPAGNGSYASELRRLASFILQPQRDACRVLQKFGGNPAYNASTTFVDGQYVVCLDGLIPALQANTCLVYSFGILNDWSFDDAMRTTGCEVHSFDPSIGLTEHQRGPHHWFHPWGLANDGRPNRLGWVLFTFTEIRRRLNHTGRLITMLKMDAEGAEWTFLSDAMKDITVLESVDQLTFETHPSRTGNEIVRQRARLLHHLERRGFRLFNSRQNVIARDLRAMDFEGTLSGKNAAFLYDLSFVRVRC